MIKQFFSLLLAFASISILAQSSSSSPYSFLGIGQTYTQKTVEQLSMGGIGVAYKDASHLNFTNPAAVADLRFATYSLGGEATFLTSEAGGQKSQASNTNLRYIAAGFPISSKAGISGGLLPILTKGYQLTNYTYDADKKPISLTRYKGNGGANKIFANFGFTPAVGLSFGIEAAFIFGKVDSYILDQRDQVSYATKYTEDATVRGGEVKIGTQYKKELKDNKYVTLGLAVKLENSLYLKGNTTMYSTRLSGLGNGQPNTVLFNNELDEKITYPTKSIIGVGYGKENKWYAGANFEYQEPITETKTNSNPNYKYESSKLYSLGGFYLPKINSISSYFDRVTYRAGLRYEKTGLLVNNNGEYNPVNDFGINVGLGLPMGNRISNINFDLEYGQKGDNSKITKENYFSVRLSMSLNDVWFRKRKID